jgi:hypothetical protein
MAAYVGRLASGEIVVSRVDGAALRLTLTEARHVLAELQRAVDAQIDAEVRKLSRADFKAE